MSSSLPTPQHANLNSMNERMDILNAREVIPPKFSSLLPMEVRSLSHHTPLPPPADELLKAMMSSSTDKPVTIKCIDDTAETRLCLALAPGRKDIDHALREEKKKSMVSDEGGMRSILNVARSLQGTQPFGYEMKFSKQTYNVVQKSSDVAETTTTVSKVSSKKEHARDELEEIIEERKRKKREESKQNMEGGSVGEAPHAPSSARGATSGAGPPLNSELARISAEEELKDKYREKFYPFALQIVDSLWKTTFIVEGIPDMNPFRAEITPANAPPNYFSVVSVPMNLVLIRNRVEEKWYWSVKSMMADVVLMLDNCRRYTTDVTNDYHIAANRMQNVFADLIKGLKKSEPGFKELIDPKLI